MWRRKAAAALALITAVTIAACDERSATNGGPPRRPIVRMSTVETTVLSTFVNLPQFSIQLIDIGDSEKRLIALQQGSIDLTVAAADVTYLALNGLLSGSPQ